MTDLVTNVRMAVAPVEARMPSTDEARAAIAAVLDDLMEPTEAMRRVAWEQVSLSKQQRGGWSALILDVWQAMLTAKRKELGL